MESLANKCFSISENSTYSVQERREPKGVERKISQRLSFRLTI